MSRDTRKSQLPPSLVVGNAANPTQVMYQVCRVGSLIQSCNQSCAVNVDDPQMKNILFPKEQEKKGRVTGGRICSLKLKKSILVTTADKMQKRRKNEERKKKLRNESKTFDCPFFRIDCFGLSACCLSVCPEFLWKAPPRGHDGKSSLWDSFRQNGGLSVRKQQSLSLIMQFLGN